MKGLPVKCTAKYSTNVANVSSQDVNVLQLACNVICICYALNFLH